MDRTPRVIWSGHVAAGLILTHAALSAYWGAGGTALLTLLSDGIQELAELREPWFAGLLWGVVIAKVCVGMIALALARGWNLPRPRWIWNPIVWLTGVVLTVYGSANIVASLLVIAGVLNPDGEQGTAFWAYLLLWAPWWVAIGVSFLLTAWRVRLRHRSRRRPARYLVV